MPSEQMAELRDRLTGALIGLARATEGNDYLLGDATAAVTVEGLYATQDNVHLDNDALLSLLDRVDQEKRKLVPACYVCAASCGRTNNYDMDRLRNANVEIRSLKYRILSGSRGIAACAYHLAARGYKDESIHKFLYKGLFAVGMEDWGMEELRPILGEMDTVKATCADMLDQADLGELKAILEA